MKLILSIPAVLALLFVANAYAEESSAELHKSTLLTYSELSQMIDAGKVRRAVIWDEGWRVTGELDEGVSFRTLINPSTPISERLVAAGVDTKFSRSPSAEGTPLWLGLFFNILPLLLFFGFFGFVMFLMRKKNNSYYGRAEAIQTEALQRLEKSQADFLNRLDEILARGKQ